MNTCRLRRPVPPTGRRTVRQLKMSGQLRNLRSMARSSQHLCLNISTAEPRSRLIRPITITEGVGGSGCKGIVLDRSFASCVLPPWPSVTFIRIEGPLVRDPSSLKTCRSIARREGGRDVCCSGLPSLLHFRWMHGSFCWWSLRQCF